MDAATAPASIIPRPYIRLAVIPQSLELRDLILLLLQLDRKQANEQEIGKEDRSLEDPNTYIYIYKHIHTYSQLL